MSFFRGLAGVWRGFRFLARAPASWPFALVPGLLWLLLVAGAAYASTTWFSPWVRGYLPEMGSAWARALAKVVEWVVAIAGVVAGALVAGILAPILAAPALEKVVDQVERKLALPPRAPLGFFAELVCGLRAQLLGFALGAPLVFVLWLVGLVVPPSQVVVLPLQYVLVAFAISWNLFDYPLTLRGIGARDRFRLLRANWTMALGFGLGFAAIFAIPCAAIVLLPAAVAGATELVAELGVDREAV